MHHIAWRSSTKKPDRRGGAWPNGREAQCRNIRSPQKGFNKNGLYFDSLVTNQQNNRITTTTIFISIIVIVAAVVPKPLPQPWPPPSSMIFILVITLNIVHCVPDFVGLSSTIGMYGFTYWTILVFKVNNSTKSIQIHRIQQCSLDRRQDGTASCFQTPLYPIHNMTPLYRMADRWMTFLLGDAMMCFEAFCYSCCSFGSMLCTCLLLEGPQARDRIFPPWTGNSLGADQ